MKTIAILGLLIGLLGCGGEEPIEPEHKACESTYNDCVPVGTDFSVTACCELTTHTCEPAPHAPGNCAP